MVLVLFGVSGCGYKLVKPDPVPVDPFGAPPAGMGQVCVLRPREIAAAQLFIVRDNGKLVGATKGASYFCYLAEPGGHRITSEGDAVEEAKLLVKSGSRYYLHQNVDNFFDSARSRLTWTPEPEAHSMVDRSSYAVLARVPGKESLPQTRPTAGAAAGVMADPADGKVPVDPTQTAGETSGTPAVPPSGDPPAVDPGASDTETRPVKRKHHRRRHGTPTSLNGADSSS